MNEKLYTILAIGCPLLWTLGVVLTFFHPLFVIVTAVGGFGTGYMYRTIEVEKEEIRKEIREEVKNESTT